MTDPVPAPILYVLLLAMPWVLCVLAFKLQPPAGLENMRLFLYIFTFVLAAAAALVLIGSDKVILFQVSMEEPVLQKSVGDFTQNHTYAHMTSTYNVTLFDRDAGIGTETDAEVLTLIYLGLAMLFGVMVVSEVFRLAERAAEGRRNSF